MKNKIATKKTRNTGLDLLRITSMLMIVMLHILGTSGVLDTATPLSVNYNIAWFLETISYCSVNCYALISGYVGIYSKHRLSSIIQLWLQVAFYSVLITVIFYFARPDIVGIKSIIKSFFPVTFSQYWYFTAYFAMWFFMPIMNAAVNHMSKKQLGVCLFFSIVVLMPINMWTNPFALKDGYSVAWLCFLYLLGAFFSKHKILQNISSKKLLMLYFLCIVVTFASKLIFVVNNSSLENILINYVSPTILIASISLLALFSNINVSGRFSKIIALFSSVSFSVYLIHTHTLIFDNILNKIFTFLATASPLILLSWIILAMFGIYFLCTLIDYLRIAIFKLLKIKQVLSFLERKLLNYASKIYRKCGL